MSRPSHLLCRAILVLLALGAAAPSASRSATAATVPAAPARRCSCVRTASIADVARRVPLLALGTADTVQVRRLPSGASVVVYRIRLTRAWRWPGADSVPPRFVEVYALDRTTCGGYVGTDEPYVVQATHAVVPADAADSVLSLAGRCSLEGPVDTAGPFGTRLRQAYGEAAHRRWARRRAVEVDSMRLVLGPGTQPTP